MNHSSTTPPSQASSAPLRGKVSLVTGASRGIGAEIARRLAEGGAAVVVNYRDDAEKEHAAAVVDDIEKAGGTASAVCADVSDPTAITQLFAQTLAIFGGLDIAILNAGGDAVVKSVIDTTEADFDRVMALNARGQFAALQLAGRQVRDGGRIVFISSSTACQPYPGTSSYSGAKIAAEVYVRVLAKEIASRRITANIVSPGMTATQTMMSQTTEARRATVIAATPKGRIAMPIDIADVVHFVATDAARGITGQILHVNGGLL
jgi:3-oxoacyl-[acyl-carrier protein] reductase